MSTTRDALAPAKPATMTRKVSSGTDDGGDIGLQGMSLAEEHGSPPTSPSHPTMSRLFRLFGAHESNPLLDGQRSYSSGTGNARGGVAVPQRLPRSRPSSSSSSAASRTPSFTTTTTVARTGVRKSISSVASGAPSFYQSAEESASSAGPSPMIKTVDLAELPKGRSSNTRTPRTPTRAAFGQVDSPSKGTSDAVATSTTIDKGKGREGTSDENAIPAAATTDTSESKQSSSSTSPPRKSDKEERRLEKKMSKLHKNIAGPVAERPAAGSANGPTLSPRRTSNGFMARRRSPAQRNASALSTHTVASATLGTPVSSPVREAFDSAATPTSQNRAITEAASSNSSAKTGSLGLGIITANKGDEKLTASLDGMLRKKNSPSNSHKIAVPSTAPPGRQSFDTPTAATDPPTLSVAALQRWVLSVGCVNFDLEKGPDLEFLYPSLGISREERDNIAFSSFPDTSIFDDGHAIFSWRVREVPLDASGSEAPVIATPSAAVSLVHSPLSTYDEPVVEPSNSLGATSLSPRKAGHHASMSARRLFGALERSRMNRSSSGDDGTAADKSRSATPSASNSPRIPASGSPDAPASPTVDAKEAHLTAPARRENSLGSTLAASTTMEHTVIASAGQDISRTSSPAVMATGEHAATALQHSQSSSTLAAVPRKQSSTSSNYIHGYCYFRQKRDATIRRGYFQKSVVILSHLPYVSFFSELVRRLGPLFFEKGMPILEAFCHDVQNWEPPEAGATMHLPLLGSVISVELPFYSFSQATAAAAGDYPTALADKKLPGTPHASQQTRGTREQQPILASIPSTPLLEVFREAIGDLWLLWECLLLAEPILVVGPDPTACSDAVWHMLDLIKPIPYAGDFRPFFTIHDYDFRTLVTKNKPSAGTIIGVTNPFMLQACKHWPHVLKVGRAAAKRMTVKKSSGTDATGALGVGSGGGKTILAGGGVAGGNSAGGGGPEHRPGLVSKRKRRISKDRPLIKQLVDAAEGKGLSIETANEVLRKYFADQTERFLAPLNRYVSSLIPAEFDLSSATETPKIKPFNTTAFLASLKLHGTPLPIKSRNLPTGAAVRQSLYVDFLQCPNFSLWLHSRIRQSQEEQYMRKLAALEKGNVTSYASARGEVESMELYARLKVEIQGINDRLIVGRRERELEPNSRWKSPNGAEMVVTTITREDADVAESDSRIVPSPSPFLLDRLAALAPTAASAAWIRQTIGEPGWQRSFTQGERTLLLRKAGLIDQLERLVATLPDDLRQTLRLKDHQSRS